MNKCLFSCKPTMKGLVPSVYFTECFGFRFLTSVPKGKYLPV